MPSQKHVRLGAWILKRFVKSRRAVCCFVLVLFGTYKIMMPPRTIEFTSIIVRITGEAHFLYDLWYGQVHDSADPTTVVNKPSKTEGRSIDFHQPPPQTQTLRFFVNFTNIRLNYSMLVPRQKCSANTLLLVVINIDPRAFDIRQAIRNSWGAEAPPDYSVRFAVGQVLNDAKLMQRIYKENLRFSDLILYSMEDSYRNSHLKVYASFHWQQAFCPNVEFVLRVNDDTVVDLKRLKYWIDVDFRTRAGARKIVPSVFGHPMVGIRVEREQNSKFYVPIKEFGYHRYPPFVQGSVYLISGAAISALLERTGEVSGYHTEDALYTGVLADLVGIERHFIWQHFWYNQQFPQQLTDFELCAGENGTVPLVTALQTQPNRPAKTSPEKIAKTFGWLRSVKCQFSRQIYLKRFFEAFCRWENVEGCHFIRWMLGLG